MNGATPSRDAACDCDGGEKSPKTPSSPRRRKSKNFLCKQHFRVFLKTEIIIRPCHMYIADYIPYSTVYESQDDVRKKGYWIPAIPVEANIVKVEKDHTSGYHIMNPFV